MLYSRRCRAGLSPLVQNTYGLSQCRSWHGHEGQHSEGTPRLRKGKTQGLLNRPSSMCWRGKHLKQAGGDDDDGGGRGGGGGGRGSRGGPEKKHRATEPQWPLPQRQFWAVEARQGTPAEPAAWNVPGRSLCPRATERKAGCA
eukprot:6463005-Amphidinium_carterae.1